MNTYGEKSGAYPGHLQTKILLLWYRLHVVPRQQLEYKLSKIELFQSAFQNSRNST